MAKYEANLWSIKFWFIRTLTDLVTGINEHMKAGWKPIGSHQHTVSVYNEPMDNNQVVRGSWSQAVVRENSPRNVRLATLRNNCLSSFRGGYHDEAQYLIFRHGMETVCNVVDDILDNGD